MQHPSCRQRGAVRDYMDLPKGSLFRARNRSQFSSLATGHPGAQVWLIGLLVAAVTF